MAPKKETVKKTTAKKAPAKKAPAKKNPAKVPEKKAPAKKAKDPKTMTMEELLQELGRGPELVRDLRWLSSSMEEVHETLVDFVLRKRVERAEEAKSEEKKKEIAAAAKRNKGKVLETVTVGLPNGVALEMKELPSGIFMGVVPVTKLQWWALLGDERPERNEENTPFNECPRDFPPFDEDAAHSACTEIEESGKDLDLGWDGFREIAFDRPAARFIEALNASDAAKKAGLAFRLPTDEEWEFACRAGSKGEYGLREDGVEIDDKNLSSVCADEWGCEVGKRMANAFGLFDMIGNVLEWTSTDTTDWDHNTVAKVRGGKPDDFNSSDEKLPHENNFNEACSGTWNQGFRLCADRRAD